MSSSTPPTNTSKLDRILADNQRDKEMGYRDKALKMYPHVCGRCAREFSGKRLSELTVHHRDHNHDNCLLYTSPSPRDQRGSRMPSSA